MNFSDAIIAILSEGKQIDAIKVLMNVVFSERNAAMSEKAEYKAALTAIRKINGEKTKRLMHFVICVQKMLDLR